MEDIILYIDNYFTGTLSNDEKKLFEKRIEDDKTFAEQVASYISARQSVYDELLAQKRQQWNAGTETALLKPAHPERRTGLRKIMFIAGTAAAACAIVYFGWKGFTDKQVNPRQVAESYINQHFGTVPLSMEGRRDSLQLAGSFFNAKKYQEAEKIYIALLESQQYGAEAIKNLGIVYLVTDKYDLAIGAFDKLMDKKELFNNPGALYKAIVLLKRNKGNDLELAIALLEKIAGGSSMEKPEAEKILKKLK